MGTNDLPLGDISVKVNDDNYHVVRFVRNGANATLQIDDYNVQTLAPQGKFYLFHLIPRTHTQYPVKNVILRRVLVYVDH